MYGNLGMARKKRFVTSREPSGRIQREQHPAASEVRRLRDIAVRDSRREEWGTELGRLYLEGSITAIMYAAGKRWRESATNYGKAIGVFPVRGASLERGSRSSPPDPDSEEGQSQALREANAAEVFFEAHAVLVAVGMGAEMAVRKLCEDDSSLVGMRELINARSGLARLAEHYRLTER